MMKLKRIILISLLLVFITTLLSATNLQKTYLLSDDVWIRANRLCISTGHLGPTPVSPTTGAEILQALERLDYNSLSPQQKQEYDFIVAEIDTPSKGVVFSAKNITLDPELFFGFEAYAFNNLKSTPVEEFFIPFRDRIPFFYGELHSFFGDLAYFDFQYTFRDGSQGFRLEDGVVKKGNDEENLFYNFTNAGFILSPALDGSWHYYGNSKNIYTFFNYQPTKVGGVIGNDFMNFYIGRSRQEFGNGVTGNMIIGDNFTYQEIAKLSFFSDIFSYYLSLTHFDNIETNTDFQLSGLHQNRLIHRFDFNIINKLRFTINIGAHMLTDSPFDLRMLNPMMIIHNWNNNSESIEWEPGNNDELNNILGFEFEYAFLPGYIATAQLVIDQMRVYGENNSTVPAAFGFLLNLKNYTTLKTGYLDSYVEGAYTSPYLYLNKKTWNGNDNYMLDHIVGYRFSQNNTTEAEYSGYIYGPDAIVISAGTEYTSFKDWSIKGSILYMAHGENGKENWRNKDNRTGENISTPSGIVEHTLSIRTGGSYSILENLKLTAELGTSFIWNYHSAANAFRTNLQAAVGISWTVL